MVAEARLKAMQILGGITPKTPIKSNDPSGLFQKYTGVSQKTLEANWAGGGHMTCCNEFVNWYSYAMGTKLGGLGAFELEDHLTKIGMHRAWVKSTESTRPNYGDIVRHAEYHMDVSMEFQGNQWYRMAAGQGGPKIGYDILTRCTSHEKSNSNMLKPYDWTAVLGWVDIEVFFPQTQPVPDWIQGYWQIVFPDSGDTYYYYFNVNRTVKWSASPPFRIPGGDYFLGTDGGIGTFTSMNTYDTQVNWRSGTSETYTYDASTDQMYGTYRGDATVATRFG